MSADDGICIGLVLLRGGRERVVGIATRYGLDSRGSNAGGCVRFVPSS